MDLKKVNKLEKEVKKYRSKLSHLEREYAETKSGSAYGVEYFDIQIKVYTKMISDIEEEIRAEKTRK